MSQPMLAPAQVQAISGIVAADNIQKRNHLMEVYELLIPDVICIDDVGAMIIEYLINF